MRRFRRPARVGEKADAALRPRAAGLGFLIHSSPAIHSKTGASIVSSFRFNLAQSGGEGDYPLHTSPIGKSSCGLSPLLAKSMRIALAASRA